MTTAAKHSAASLLAFLQSTFRLLPREGTRFNRLSLAAVVVGTLAAAPLLSGCPGPDWPKCENDDQCKENDGKEVNYVCVFGQCQRCGRDSDCGAGQRCNKKTYQCEAKCSSDAACGDGRRCEAGACLDGAREPAGAGVGEDCVETGDCQSGLKCSEGKCAEDDGTDATDTSDTTDNTDMSAECESDTTVQFAFNEAALTPEARETLNSFAMCLEKNEDWKLTIEGHADERGTDEYNMQLGEKRAGEVRKYLVNKGIPRSRLKTISYGEEKPKVNASNEDAWATNRRGRLVIQ